MGRPRSTALYEAGPAVVTGIEGRYRIRWYEKGRRIERTATTLAAAQAKADEVAERIRYTHGGTLSVDAAFGALCQAWASTPKAKKWKKGYRDNMASLLRVHVEPVLGHIACDRLTEDGVQAFLDGVSAAGYSASTLSHLTRLLRSVGRFGIKRGIWSQRSNPLEDIAVPKTEDLIDRKLVPSTALVADLVKNVAAQAPSKDQKMRRTWMVRAAAGCGLRWGEVLALDASCVTLSTREVRITQALEERTRTLGLPKTGAGVRTVIIPTSDMPLWRAVVKATPSGPFALTETGLVWRNANWHSQVYGVAIAATTGWPTGARFHSLRHHAIYTWLDKGIHIGDVSCMAGHHSADFTYRRYVGASSDHLDVARKLL